MGFGFGVLGSGFRFGVRGLGFGGLGFRVQRRDQQPQHVAHLARHVICLSQDIGFEPLVLCTGFEAQLPSFKF